MPATSPRSLPEKKEAVPAAGDSDVPHGSRNQYFYGWLILLLAISVMVATSPGQTFGITFFNPQFQDAFGLGYAQISTSYLLATLLAAAFLPAIGRLSDRWGLRKSILCAVVAMAITCACASLIQGWIALFFIYLALRAIGPGTMVLLANNTLAAWFDRRLGLVISLMQLSMAAAMAIIPGVLFFLIDKIGWRETYMLLSGILLFGLTPLIFLFYRSDPRDMNQFPDGSLPEQKTHEDVLKIGMTVRESSRFASYWILLAAAAVWAMIGTGLVFHITPLATECGLVASMARSAMIGMAVGMASAQVIGGFIADRVSSRILVTVAVGFIAIGCAVLSLSWQRTFICGFSLFGLGQGLMTVVSGTVWPRYFGRLHLGEIRGVALGAAVAGSSVGPLLIGLSIDTFDSTTPALLIYTGIALIVTLGCCWATPPRLPRAATKE